MFACAVGYGYSLFGRQSYAQPDSQGCSSLPNHGTLKAALDKATAEEKSGLNNHMWATIVDRDGVVCAVAFSGYGSRGAVAGKPRDLRAESQHRERVRARSRRPTRRAPASRPASRLSTANLYSAVQPGGSLFGLQLSNPVDTSVAYHGPYASYGTREGSDDGRPLGGVNVFGGGLGLYAAGKRMVGGVGVSGDTSCADHNIAWRVRAILGLDHLMGVGGVSGDKARPDNIIFDIANGASKGGFGHPQCLNTGDAAMLPAVKE